MMRSSCLVVAMLAAGCASARNTPAPPLEAPALTSPPAGALLTKSPRTTVLQWAPVTGAVRYAIDVDCFDCCRIGAWCSDVMPSRPIASSAATSYTATMPGDNRMRWRVWAIDRRSRPGAKSEWRELVYDTSPNRGLATVPSTYGDPRTGELYPRGTVTPPHPLSTPNAKYTEAALRARTSGIVAMAIVLGVDGRVEQVTVLRGLRPDLDANAIAAVKTWEFEPAMKDGRPVPVSFEVTMSYNLQ